MAAFSTVAFRYGHSEVNMIIPRLDENRRPIPQGPILFRDGYFNPPMYCSHIVSFSLSLLSLILDERKRELIC
jgi:hypothetical protein